ncbi:NUDIX hydrolase [Natronospora cellulosivora (SeqCode)]
MNKVIKKVSAYIVRESVRGYDELLVFSHKDYPDVPVQIPGGTVEDDEDLIDALKREIYEETGLTDYSIIKELGEVFYTNEVKEKYNRHFYLLRVPETTLDTWDHEVSGKGEDNGLIFTYFWYGHQEVFSIYKRDCQFLSREFIPSLFPK